jgi:hypothetical protein
VEENRVLGNKASGASTLGSGGIVVISNKSPGSGADPVNNAVIDNTALDNTPYDLVYDGNGSGNRFEDNRCQTSLPPGLCQNGHND